MVLNAIKQTETLKNTTYSKYKQIERVARFQ